MSFLVDPIKFWLIGARLSGFLTATPAFGDMPIPKTVKAAMVLWLTVSMLPVTPGVSGGFESIYEAAWLIAGEFLLGMGIGTVSRYVFSAIQFGGTMIDSELSFLTAQQVNPFMPFTGGVFGQLMFIVALFYFWVLDFFSLMLMGLHHSFELLPLASLTPALKSPDGLIRAAGGIFSGGLMIAAPVIALMFFVTVAIGFLARAVQGLQIFSEALTTRVWVGLGAVLLFLPLILIIVRDQMEKILPAMTQFLRGAIPPP